ncbi:MAG: hypothetical protein IPG04_27940 [Polyangiaceae bacterium]|nr:hypothetical protein [Polyangiaceae bacterium]
MSVLVVEVGEGASAARVSLMLDAAAGVGSWDAIGRHAEPGLALGVRARALGPEDERHGGVALDDERGLVVAWDGRIDDRAATCRALALEPGAPSARVALEAFARWGERAPAHLLGDFAFVVFARRDRALFIARDRVGVRPLYALTLPSGVVRLSSSERALFACSDAVEHPNLRALASALAGAAVLKTETLRAGVEVIPAASTVWLRAGARSARVYYRPDPGAVDTKTSRQGHSERVSAALELAVADRGAGLGRPRLVERRRHRRGAARAAGARAAALAPHALQRTDLRRGSLRAVARREARRAAGRGGRQRRRIPAVAVARDRPGRPMVRRLSGAVPGRRGLRRARRAHRRGQRRAAAPPRSGDRGRARPALAAGGRALRGAVRRSALPPRLAAPRPSGSAQRRPAGAARSPRAARRARRASRVPHDRGPRLGAPRARAPR